MRFVVAGPSMAAALLCTRFPASPAERVREDVYSLRRRALPAADGKNLLGIPTGISRGILPRGNGSHRAARAQDERHSDPPLS